MSKNQFSIICVLLSVMILLLVLESFLIFQNNQFLQNLTNTSDFVAENNQPAQNSDDILYGTLDGGADIALDAESIAKDSSEAPEFMPGILDGGADIALDATP